MRLLIAFVVCYFALADGGETPGITFPPEIVEMLENFNTVCMEETGISHEIVEELKKAKLNDDPKTKCYLKCMMRQLQTMTEDGDLDINWIDATMPAVIKEHGGMETVRKCSHIKEADMCETAYQLMLCFQKENPELTALFE